MIDCDQIPEDRLTEWTAPSRRGCGLRHARRARRRGELHAMGCGMRVFSDVAYTGLPGDAALRMTTPEQRHHLVRDTRIFVHVGQGVALGSSVSGKQM
jgi:hypothetical protein